MENLNNYKYRNAWVTPDGKFYGVEYWGHYTFLWNQFKIIEEKTVEKLGWVRLTQDEPFFQCEKPYTQAQINRICDYYEKIEALYALDLFYKVM